MIIDPYRFALAGGGGGDPFFGVTVLLCHFEGADASTSLLDSSSFLKTIVTNGAAALSTSAPIEGVSSLLTPGNGSARAQSPMDSDLDLSTASQWTAELWVDPADNTWDAEVFLLSTRSFPASPSGWQLTWNGPHNRISFIQTGVSGLASGQGPTASMTPGTRYHVALTWDGTNFTIWFDGVGGTPFDTAGSGSADPYAAPYFGIGGGMVAAFTGSGWWGKIDEVRVTRGCRYTANFTPPAIPFPDA